MTFYQNEVERLKKTLYPHDDLTKKIIQSKLYIDKHFSDNINLDKIAGNAHVSKFHFIRIFKKYFGRTPNQYLQQVRIENAKKLLQKGKTTDEVCLSIGFTSKTSFISLFKKLTGTTPFTWARQKSNIEE